MRKAHIIFYAGVAGETPKAPIKQKSSPEATPATHQRFSHQRINCFPKNVSKKVIFPS
jgi:hypothetical protein